MAGSVVPGGPPAARGVAASDDRDSARGQPHRDRAVQVRAEQVDAGQVGEHVGVGMAVVVAGSGGHDRDASLHGVEEPLGVGVAPVMGHLDHGGA